MKSYSNVDVFEALAVTSLRRCMEGAHSFPKDTLTRILFLPEGDLVVRTRLADIFNHLVAVVARVVPDFRNEVAVAGRDEFEAMGLGEAIEPLYHINTMPFCLVDGLSYVRHSE